MHFMGKLFEIEQKLIEIHQFEIATKSENGERIDARIRWTDLGVSNNPAGGLSGIQPVYAPYVPLFAFLG